MDGIQSHFNGLRQAVEESYIHAVESAQAERDEQLRAIDALEQKLVLNDSGAVADTSQKNGNHGQFSSPSNVDRLLNVLDSEFRTVKQLAEKSGLSNEQVSAALTRDKVKRILKRQGEPGSLKYAASAAAGRKRAENGITSAILSVLATRLEGITKPDLLDAVEKAKPDSKADDPRVAIAATIASMQVRGLIKTVGTNLFRA
jgi:hypothetical protein